MAKQSMERDKDENILQKVGLEKKDAHSATPYHDPVFIRQTGILCAVIYLYVLTISIKRQIKNVA